MRKDYDFEISMMEAELGNPTEEIDLRKDRSRAERRQRTRRAKSREAQTKKLKSAHNANIREQGKDLHWFVYFPDTHFIRVTTERKPPIRVRRKWVDR